MANELANIKQPSNSLVPSNLVDAIKLAELMSGSKLVPAHLQGKPSDCFLVIEQSMRWGMSPFAVAQCTSVISGKLMYEGKLVAGVINGNGNLSKRINYSFDGDGENRKCTASATIAGESEPRTVEVVYKDVKTSNQFWTKQPDQQLTYSASRNWARRHMPELMLGVYSPEEMETSGGEKVVDVTFSEVKPAEKPKKSATSKPSSPTIEHQPAPPAPTAEPEKPFDYKVWVPQFAAGVRTCTDSAELDAWIEGNLDAYNGLEAANPTTYAKIKDLIAERRTALTQSDPFAGG